MVTEPTADPEPEPEPTMSQEPEPAPHKDLPWIQNVTPEPEPEALLVQKAEPVVMPDQMREQAHVAVPVGILAEFDSVKLESIHFPFLLMYSGCLRAQSM